MDIKLPAQEEKTQQKMDEGQENSEVSPILRQESVKLPRSSFPLKPIPPFRQKSVDEEVNFEPAVESKPGELADIKV